jgi:hypothetical protein
MDRKVLTVAAFGMRFEGAAVQLVIDGTEQGGAETMYVVPLQPDQARALQRVAAMLVSAAAAPAG